MKYKTIFLTASLALPLSVFSQPNRIPGAVIRLDNAVDRGVCEYLINKMGGWNQMDEFDRGIVLLVADRMDNAKKLAKDVERISKEASAPAKSAPPAKPVTSSSSYDKWIGLSITATEQYLQQPFSKMSIDYLGQLKTNFKSMGTRSDVQKLVGSIEQFETALLIYNDISNALRQPFSKAKLGSIEKRIFSLNTKGFSEIQLKEIQDIYDDYSYYTDAVKLCQTLIKKVNNDVELKLYREDGASSLQSNAFLIYRRYYKEVDNQKIDKTSHDNFRRYVDRIPWLKQRFDQYKQDMETDALKNSSVEDEILKLKF